MAFITAAIIDAAIGGPLRNQVTDNNQALLLDAIYKADALTQSDLAQKGYSLDPVTCNTSAAGPRAPIQVEMASVGHFIELTFSRRNQPLEPWAAYLRIGPAIADGTIRPSGLSPADGEGTGAVTITSGDTSLSGSIPTQLSMENLKVF